MTGLPSRISEVQYDNTLTFLLRSNRVYLSPLDKKTIANSYEKAFTKGKREIDFMVLDEMSRAVKGYAYAFQTIGYYAWRFSRELLQLNEEVLKQTIRAAKKDLFRNAYERMYMDLSKNDRDFIEAIIKAGTDRVTTKQLQDILNKPINYISVYRARLLDDQLITSPQRGVVQLALPFFAEFVEKSNLEHLS
ncbi:hypothetical protein [Lactobacillus crispatus]|jgi:hypothetical protein|uniref:ATP-binding protein n=1 Tax=Lactobacillus crispatus TaxID=47770 RepID=A0A135YRY6_9LACO|nr:hypothetical protein [Lactobacillus crispatus]STX16029.1 Uncharacterised protein [Lactobacillus acidophilus]EEJ70890.1 hypothetical protein HMPREF0506_0033 [Lactobacillus crispatus JV-V01]KWU03125.1 hypothetical protein AEL96_12050 [Lactobacillus crispatus]KWU07973.1 hypothetical protein AEL99_08735 [Lactobacillus crispatus]KXI12169.1 hypothetical protein HMPREF3209_02234 [Lactobacillus crispatus]